MTLVFLAIACKSKAMKLEMRCEDPPFPETIGLPAKFGLWIFNVQRITRIPVWMLTTVKSETTQKSNKSLRWPQFKT